MDCDPQIKVWLIRGTDKALIEVNLPNLMIYKKKSQESLY